MGRKRADTEQYHYFRHTLVHRVWALVLNCPLHRRALKEFFHHAVKDPYKCMAKDPGGHSRIKMQDAFLSQYPESLDCDDGCSLALSLMIKDLKASKDELMVVNDGLAWSFARRYTSWGAKIGFELMDLVQHARMGLAEGIERFQPEKGFTFSTYGCWWIRHVISRAITNGNLVRIPVCRYYEGGSQPTVLSLNAKMDNGEHSATYQDMLEEEGRSPQEQVHLHYDVQELLQQLSKLPAEVQDILRMRFGLAPYDEPHTLNTIGQKYRLSKERIRQVQNQYLRAMRKRMAA